MYYKEKPIDNKKDDHLSRYKFAKNISDTIFDYFFNEKEEDSIVIGLNGDWGIGKTSVLKLIEKEIVNYNDKNKDKIQILHLESWVYRGNNDITGLFFKALIDMLVDNSQNNKFKKAFDKVRHSHKFDPINLFWGIVQILTPTAFGLRTFPSIQTASTLEKAVNKNRTFSDMKDILEKHFGQHKMVCFIDDIDRLSDEDIAEVFKLVKEVSEFKNIIFILAYDKKIVKKALNHIQHQHGEEYINKIINVPIDIPLISKNELKTEFFRKFTEYFQDNFEKEFFNDLEKEYKENISGDKNFINFQKDLEDRMDKYKFTYKKEKFLDEFKISIEKLFRSIFIGFFNGAYNEKYIKINVDKFISYYLKSLEEFFQEGKYNSVDFEDFNNDYVEKYMEDIKFELKKENILGFLGAIKHVKNKCNIKGNSNDHYDDMINDLFIENEENSLNKTFRLDTESSKLKEILKNATDELNLQKRFELIYNNGNCDDSTINNFIKSFKKEHEEINSNCSKIKIINDSIPTYDPYVESINGYGNKFFYEFNDLLIIYKNSLNKYKLDEFSKKRTKNQYVYDVDQIKYLLDPTHEFGDNIINEERGIIHFFKNLRDIKRFFNVLGSDLNVAKNEVYFKDFLIITVIQLFKPEVYNAIKSQKRLITQKYDKNEIYINNQEYKDFKKILEIVDGDANVKFLLRQCFRKIDVMYRIDELFNEGEIKIDNDLIYNRHNQKFTNNLEYFDEHYTISSKKHFDTYFKLVSNKNFI